jgi:hypothetical protein
MDFLVGISIPIALIMFGVAGFMIFGSPESPTARDKGKKIFKSVFLGFMLVISGWLVVQTVLGVLVKDEFNFTTFWNNLSCEEITRERFETTQGTVDSFINSVIGTPVALDPVTLTTSYGCGPGLQYDPERNSCFSPGTGSYSAPVVATYSATGALSESSLLGHLTGTQQYRAELQTVCAREGLSNCSLAQAIMAIESGGRPRCSPANACGLMQVIPSTARGLDPSLRGLSDAQIRNRLNSDNSLSMTLGVRYIRHLDNQFNSTAEVIAAYNGGPRANNPSSTCPGQRWWECNANSGYAETRKYVPNVLNTLSLVNNQN